MPSKPKTDRKEVPNEQRVLVVCLRFQQHSFSQIAAITRLKRSTAASIWQRCNALAYDKEDLLSLLEVIDDLPREGRPPLIQDGTPASAQLRDVFLEYHDLSLYAVAYNVFGLKASEHTLRKVAQDHRDLDHPFAIVRRVQLIKPLLTDDHIDLRYQFSTWVIKQLKEGVIFIFTDECYASFGAPYRQKKYTTRPRGRKIDYYEFAGHRDSPAFSLMIWSVIGPLPAMPYWVWRGETTADRLKSEIHLQQINKENEEADAIYIAEAHQNPNSAAARKVTATNALIERTNLEIRQRAPLLQPQGTIPHTYRKRKPEQVFKSKGFKRESTRGGIDAYIYAYQVLKPHLIPYIRRCQGYASTLPHRPKVVLIEDNVSLHARAWQTLSPEDKEGIERCEFWPSRSPDMNMIEPCWQYLKRQLPSLELPHSSANETIEEAVAGLARILGSNDYYKFTQRQLEKFPLRAQQVYSREGKNNFNA